MRILFLCGSFEPGRDGVGDYTRRLGEELIIQGHDVAVAAIHDSHLKEIFTGNKMVQEEISVLRIPARLEEDYRFSLLKDFVDKFDPEWISLQYVPFSFHPKGLSFGLAKRLEDIGKGKHWEIMFHEICVGMHKGASSKLLIWGWVQKYLAKDLLKKLKPAVVHTHIAVYKKQLELFGASTILLPLFSNIPLLYAEAVKEKLRIGTLKTKTIDLLIFASIQEGAPIDLLAAEAKRYKAEQNISLRLLIIGRSGIQQEHWVSTWKAAGLEVLQMGEQGEKEVSPLLANAVFGIFTTPFILAGKSGAVAAMREHGINLLGVARKWEARGITAALNPLHLMEYREGNLAAFLSSKPDFSILPTVVSVAEQFSTNLKTTMKVFVTHPTGNRNVRAVMSSFEATGILAFFNTTLAVNPDSKLIKLLPEKFQKEMLRRSYPISFKLVRTRPVLELLRNVLPKIGFKGAIQHETGFASVDKIYEDLDRSSASLLKSSHDKLVINAVYCYEDGAVHTFNMAKSLGVECIYDLPIGYWKAARVLLKTELERWPEWAATLTGFKDSEQKLSRKDEELKLADRIFVASSFTAKTLNYFPGKLAPIEVIPYGFPPVIGKREYAAFGNRPLRLLFVGGLSQRKGIADLFAAVKNIGKSVELTVVGRKTSAECAALDAALKEHHWIPSLSHEEILKLMREHDVFVFPSLFEGFGLVITEAMSQGTPVITTDRTAGPDLITHGKDGWIIEAGSTAALQKQIEELLSNPDVIIAAGKAAMKRAKERPWEKYGNELAAAIMNKE